MQPNKAYSFFCFLLFVQSFNCLYLRNKLPNLCGVLFKLKPKQYLIENAGGGGNHIFRLQTHFAWWHHICIPFLLLQIRFSGGESSWQFLHISGKLCMVFTEIVTVFFLLQVKSAQKWSKLRQRRHPSHRRLMNLVNSSQRWDSGSRKITFGPNASKMEQHLLFSQTKCWF